MVTRLGEKPRMGKDRMLLQLLDRINQNEKTTLLIIDEAHLIDPKALTDLRVLISPIGEKIPLKILLCGQEDLRHILKRSSHADLLYRITLRLFLNPYAKEQTTNISITASPWPGDQPKSSNRRPLPSSMIMPREYLGRSTMSLPLACSMQRLKTSTKSTMPWSTIPWPNFNYHRRCYHDKRIFPA
jgi:hypothetical protein